MPVSSSTEHWIKPDALTINLNHFGDPDYLQVSVLAGAVVMVFKQDVIGYNAAHNYRTWTLEAANTYLETSSAYNVYARLTRSEVNARALVVYDTVLRDIEGREITYAEDGSEVLGEANPEYFFVFLGQISASVNSNGESVQREWTMDFRFGNLNTNQYQNEEGGGEWTKMFRLNKVTDMIDVLKKFSSAIFQKLFIGEKEIRNIQRSVDAVSDQRLDDVTLPTTKFTEDRYLSKQKDDRSSGKIASDKGFEVGKFTEGTLGSGASIFEREGNTYGEVDFLKVRKKATFTEITVQELKHVGGEIILSPAAMICSRVEESENGWKCYFNTEDSDGRKVYQEFEVNDLARCQTFNLSPKGAGDLVGNHYYWRKVVSVGDDYIELSKADCDSLSDIPLEGDNISQLGNTTNTERQAAIILSAYGADAPSYKQYNGIDGFSLEGKQVTKLSPYGNELTGVLNIEAGSKGWNNLEGLPDSIQNAVDLANKAQETIDGTSIGAVNLLQNSGFTGSYQSEDMVASDLLSDSTELFSRKTDKWEGNITVYADSNAVSGYSAQLGNITQQVKELIAGEKYVVSFKARGSSVNLSCGNFKAEQKLTSAFTKYSFNFEFGGSRTFSMDGNARICDLQLERGTISTDWNPSPYDNDKSFAEFQSLKYLQDAIVNGNTSVLGGLILASMLKLGNYKDGKMQKVNAGVSGICNDENDVAFWAGGSFENAIKTIMKFKENPQYKPTESEWASLAKFAVSHGGDAVFRGTIFAENGIFRGRLEAEEGFLHGKFETSIEGNRIVIDPEEKSLKMYNGAGLEILTMTFVDGGENWTWGEVNLKRYNYDSETEQGVLAFESRMTASNVDLYNRIDNTWTRMTTAGYQVTASANERHYNVITALDKRYLDNVNFVYVSRIQSDCWAVDAANVGIGEVYAEPEYDDEGTLLSRVLKVKV